jgi:hypothetical protein
MIINEETIKKMSCSELKQFRAEINEFLKNRPNLVKKLPTCDELPKDLRFMDNVFDSKDKKKHNKFLSYRYLLRNHNSFSSKDL